MSEVANFSSEFEKIFGAPTVRQTLFAIDDEEYNKMRQYIMDQPKIEYDKKALPFNGISISYSQKKHNQKIIDQIDPVVIPLTIIEPIKPSVKQKKSAPTEQHLFYIKRQIASGVSCDASGFYNALTDKFIIKKGSLCAKDLPDNKFRSGDYERRSFLRHKCRSEDDCYYLLEDVECANPGIAALYVTGIIPRSGWIVWHDNEGVSLREVYKK